MTSLGMGVGINESVMGVLMGCLDFGLESSTPTAAPVTEHVEINCAPHQDTDEIFMDSNATHLMLTQTQQQQIHQHFMHQQQLQYQQVQQLILQQQRQHRQQPSQAKRETPQAQQGEQEHPQHRAPQQIVPQHWQPALLIDQQSQLSHNSIQSPTSNTSSPFSEQHLENLVTVTFTPSESMQPELKLRLILKQETMAKAELKQRQQPLHQPPYQQQMDIEQDQSSMHRMGVAPDISEVTNQSKTSDIDPSDASEDFKVGILDGAPMQCTKLNSPNTSELKTSTGSITWTTEAMEPVFDAPRKQTMSLTKASATNGTPSIKTEKENSLNSALEAVRTRTMSVNKASKKFGIPAHEIARRERIRLAMPYYVAKKRGLEKILINRTVRAIRAGQTSVCKASKEFGIPSSTLHKRCKREGIQLPRLRLKWSEDTMMKALESVYQGQMSVSDAATHYNIPISTLYRRLKYGKYDTPKIVNLSSTNHSGTNVEAIGGNIGSLSGISGNVTTLVPAINGVSSPQLELPTEPQQNEHCPANTQQYNPALTSPTTSSAQPSSQAPHVLSSPSPVNIHIINSNHQHHQRQPNLSHQTVVTTHNTTLQGAQHHIILPQHHIINRQPLQQIQLQPQYQPLCLVMKKENDMS